MTADVAMLVPLVDSRCNDTRCLCPFMLGLYVPHKYYDYIRNPI